MAKSDELKRELGQEIRIFFKTPNLYSSKLDISDKLDHTVFLIKNIFNVSETLNIDINFKNLSKIAEERKNALNKTYLEDSKYVNAKIIWKNKSFNAKIKLKGTFSEHWLFSKQWSFKVELKDGKTINGMNQFSISKHVARQYPYYLPISRLQNEMNLLTPKYKDIHLKINNESWGLMLMEEQPNDIFLELNKLPFGPTFRTTNMGQLGIPTPYNYWSGKLKIDIDNYSQTIKKTVNKNITSNLNLISILKSINETIILKDKKENIDYIKHFFDIDKFSKNLFSNLLWVEGHSSFPNNLKLFFNPHNLKIEPIPHDYQYPAYFNAFKFHEISDDQLLKQIKDQFSPGEYFYWLYETEEFKNLYNQNILKYKEKVSAVPDYIKFACKKYGPICENYFETDKIARSYNLIIDNKYDLVKEVINSSKNNTIDKIDIFNYENSPKNIGYKDKIYFRFFNDGEFYFYNLTPYKILINDLEFIKNGETFFTEQANFNLDESKIEDIFFIKKNLSNNKKIIEADQIKVNFTMENKKYKELTFVENSFYKVDNLINFYSLSVPDFLESLDKNYFIKRGEYFVEKPILLPEGSNLIIEPGVTLRFSENSYILIRNASLKIGDVDSLKTKLISKNKSWRGIYTINTDVEFDNVEIEHINYFNNMWFMLPGGISFYNSNVKINKSVFKNSYAEDFINLINSKFIIADTHIENTLSDAIDSDYSEGLIENVKIKNAKGDGLDTSYSKLEINNLYIQNVLDKGISIGEKSNIIMKNVEVNEASYAIAIKDQSKVTGEELQINKSKEYDLISFVKKNYFDEPSFELNNLTSDKLFLVNENIVGYINNKKVKTSKFNPKTFYQ